MKNSSDMGKSVILTLLFPILGLFEGISSIRNKTGKALLILFITFFGYQLIYNVAGTQLGEGADCARYAVLLKWAANLSDLSFSEFFSHLGSHDNIDYFNPILLYVVSRFTNNPHIYFMVFAFIFASFYIRNIQMILEQCKPDRNRLWSLLVVVSCFILSVHDFGGIRMPLAFQVFLFGVFRYVFYGKKNGLAWVASSILVHFSMFAFVLLFFVFLWAYKFNVRYFFVFFIFGHLLNSVDIPFIQQFFSLLPGGVEERLNLYTNEANMEQFGEGGRFYLGAMNLWGRLDSLVLRFYIPIAMGLLFINRVTLKRSEEYIFKLSLYIYGCALVLSNMPSGYRFMLPSSLICFATICIMFNRNQQAKNILYNFTKLYSPLLVFFLVHRFRFILNEVGFSVFYTNFITMFFVDDNVPILEVIKQIF